MEIIQTITVSADINAPISEVWDKYNQPEHVVKWNNASDDWHTPKAVNNLEIGGTFTYRMEAKDGSAGFDFGGTYDDVQEHEFIEYTMDDGRTVDVAFDGHGDHSHITVTFDAENENSIEKQKEGWQAILNNFKKYVESN